MHIECFSEALSTIFTAYYTRHSVHRLLYWVSNKPFLRWIDDSCDNAVCCRHTDRGGAVAVGHQNAVRTCGHCVRGSRGAQSSPSSHICSYFHIFSSLDFFM